MRAELERSCASVAEALARGHAQPPKEIMPSDLAELEERRLRLSPKQSAILNAERSLSLKKRLLDQSAHDLEVERTRQRRVQEELHDLRMKLVRSLDNVFPIRAGSTTI